MSSIWTEARPVRAAARLVRKSSTALSMRVLSWVYVSFKAGIVAITDGAINDSLDIGNERLIIARGAGNWPRINANREQDFKFKILNLKFKIFFFHSRPLLFFTISSACSF